MLALRLRRIARQLGLMRRARPFNKPPIPHLTPEEWVKTQAWGPLTDEDTPEMNRLRGLAEAAVREGESSWAAARAAVQSTHPGFTVTCQECDSDQVTVENSVNWSSCSGIWGAVSLVCLDCGERVEIFTPLS